jgi:hypothetical protein
MTEISLRDYTTQLVQTIPISALWKLPNNFCMRYQAELQHVNSSYLLPNCTFETSQDIIDSIYDEICVVSDAYSYGLDDNADEWYAIVYVCRKFTQLVQLNDCSSEYMYDRLFYLIAECYMNVKN